VSAVHWPDDARPEGAAIHAVNVVDATVTREAVWPWLVRAARLGSPAVITRPTTILGEKREKSS
jgi:hypothetical protein